MTAKTTKKVGLGAVSLLLGLYTTFVLQSLWNWFVTDSLHVPEISYWAMYGLYLFVQLLFQSTTNDANTVANERRHEAILTMLEFGVPEQRLREAKDVIKAKDESVWEVAGYRVATNLIGVTVTLVIGWAVHLFL